MPGNAKSLGIALAAALTLASLSAPAFAQKASKSEAGQSRMLGQLYLNGQARLAKGDPAGAAAVFQVTSEVAPELPQMQYALALAQLLADFSQRERALAAIDKALAADPAHPLYNIVKVMADPRLSTLELDGALSIASAGFERFQAAAAKLDGAKGAVNSRYLAAVLDAAQPTGEATRSLRLAGFGAMIGAGGSVRLPQWKEPQAFGRLLAMSVPDAALAAYEPRMVARLQNGLESLTNENIERTRIRSRRETVKQQISVDPTDDWSIGLVPSDG